MRKKYGITLITLIITIILLLILLGVSTEIVIRKNLFGSTKDAVNRTNAKVKEQQTSIDELMEEFDKIEKNSSEDSKKPENSGHNWKYLDESTRKQIRCECTICKNYNNEDNTGRTLSIGQQIMYSSTGTGSTTISAEKASGYVGTGKRENGIKIATTKLTGNLITSYYVPEQGKPTTTQTITADTDTKWVVFGFDDTDKDGINESLLLTTEHPTQKDLVLYGEAAYTNIIDEMDRMCKELYGEEARGIRIEDVNKVLGYTVSNSTTKIKDLGETWTTIKEYNTNNKEGMFYDPANPNGLKDNGSVLGEYIISKYSYKVGNATTTGEETVSSTIDENSKKMIFGSSNGYKYWLASRGVGTLTNNVYFGPGRILTGTVTSSISSLFNSQGTRSSSYNLGLCLRSIVSLTADIPESGEVLEFS